MSTTIQGITFDNQVVTAKDHGSLFQCLLKDGIVSGCTLSKTYTSITIAKGYLILAGRLIRLASNLSLSVAQPSSTGFVRVVAAINLSGAATQETFEQVSFTTEYSKLYESFRPLTKGNINGGATLYEFEFCVYRATTSGVTSIYRDVPKSGVDLSGLGVISVGAGGTGRQELTANALLVGNGTNGVSQIAPATAGQVLMATGTTSLPAYRAQTNITNLGVITVGTWQGTAVGIAYGGTGATNGATGLKNLLAAGATILSANQYGSSLPSSGTKGQLFFKTVG